MSPGADLKSVIILVHGLGDHMNRYIHVAEMFNQNSFGFTGVDLPGHGKSDGKRGHIKSYIVISEMIDILINECKKTFPGMRGELLIGTSGSILRYNLSDLLNEVRHPEGLFDKLVTGIHVEIP